MGRMVAPAVARDATTDDAGAVGSNAPMAGKLRGVRVGLASACAPMAGAAGTAAAMP